MPLKVALFRSTVSVISRAIEWETRSPYCHAAIWLRDGSLIESIEGAGVRQVPNWQPAASDVVDFFTVAANLDQDATEAFLRAQVGKPYANRDIIGFLVRAKDQEDPNAFFCSELVFAAILAGNVALLHRIEPFEVSPGMLALSPLLNPTA
jgi:uncharacterized protein YycO